jgi:hypothetical protein
MVMVLAARTLVPVPRFPIDPLLNVLGLQHAKVDDLVNRFVSLNETDRLFAPTASHIKSWRKKGVDGWTADQLAASQGRTPQEVWSDYDEAMRCWMRQDKMARGIRRRRSHTSDEPRDSYRSTVSVRALLSACPDMPVRLFSRYGGELFTATISSHGLVEWNGVLYSSLSGAAVAVKRSRGVTGAKPDGWHFWRTWEVEKGDVPTGRMMHDWRILAESHLMS